MESKRSVRTRARAHAQRRRVGERKDETTTKTEDCLEEQLCVCVGEKGKPRDAGHTLIRMGMSACVREGEKRRGVRKAIACGEADVFFLHATPCAFVRSSLALCPFVFFIHLSLTERRLTSPTSHRKKNIRREREEKKHTHTYIYI